MTLPKNFWEQFDKRLNETLDKRFNSFDDRLDKMDKRFDKIEQRLDRIETRMDGFDERFEQMDKQMFDMEHRLNSKIKQVINWTNRQDLSIEKEMTKACFNHLASAYKGFIAVIPSKAILGSIIKDKSGMTITDFDGVVVLTNNRDYARYLSDEKKDKGEKELYEEIANHKAYMVIIEAKQHLTRAKVMKKLKQRETIQQILPDLKLEHVDKFIGLYIGGTEVDPEAASEIHSFLEMNKSNELVGILELNGARFSINDAKNDYGKSDVLLYGGRKAQSKRVIGRS